MKFKIMNTNEVAKTVEFLTSDPFIFSSYGWSSFNDRGNACSGRMDEFDSLEEEVAFEQFKMTVKKAMPPKTALYNRCASSMQMYFDRCSVKYDYVIKLVTRALFDSTYEEVVDLVKSSLEFRYQRIGKLLASDAFLGKEGADEE